jgi:hypothetical protein
MPAYVGDRSFITLQYVRQVGGIYELYRYLRLSGSVRVQERRDDVLRVGELKVGMAGQAGAPGSRVQSRNWSSCAWRPAAGSWVGLSSGREGEAYDADPAECVCRTPAYGYTEPLKKRQHWMVSSFSRPLGAVLVRVGNYYPETAYIGIASVVTLLDF